MLYETTDLFYEHFGIRSIDDLPNAAELRKVKLPEPALEAVPEGEQMNLTEVTSDEPAVEQDETISDDKQPSNDENK
jgi:segregation and condensation protein B